MVCRGKSVSLRGDWLRLGSKHLLGTVSLGGFCVERAVRRETSDFCGTSCYQSDVTGLLLRAPGSGPYFSSSAFPRWERSRRHPPKGGAESRGKRMRSIYPWDNYSLVCDCFYVRWRRKEADFWQFYFKYISMMSRQGFLGFVGFFVLFLYWLNIDFFFFPPGLLC